MSDAPRIEPAPQEYIDRMTLSETLALATVMDDIRGEVGVVYPGER